MKSALAVMALASGCGVVTSIEVTAPPTVAATATPFSLADQRGVNVTLASLLATGDVALVFYRGHW
jgi:hypothetical protein